MKNGSGILFLTNFTYVASTAVRKGGRTRTVQYEGGAPRTRTSPQMLPFSCLGGPNHSYGYMDGALTVGFKKIDLCPRVGG